MTFRMGWPPLLSQYAANILSKRLTWISMGLPPPLVLPWILERVWFPVNLRKNFCRFDSFRGEMYYALHNRGVYVLSRHHEFYYIICTLWFYWLIGRNYETAGSPTSYCCSSQDDKLHCPCLDNLSCSGTKIPFWFTQVIARRSNIICSNNVGFRNWYVFSFFEYSLIWVSQGPLE